MTQQNSEQKIRIASIDQFRGFAIFGMILVNYLNQFEVIHETFKHPKYGMTFANAIAPFFLIAVGMGFRMSLERRIATVGKMKSYLDAAKRYVILILIGIVMYGPDPVCDMWDALVDIGFAGLLSLPFILSKKWLRIAMAFLYLIIYQLLFFYTGYGEWTMQHSIDGGPLGIFSWASILLLGTVLMDDLFSETPSRFILKSVIGGTILMVSGYILSRLQPAELWQFSQRSMTMAYPIFASGLSFVVFAAFFWLADQKKIVVPHLTMLGLNPLVLYILQGVIIELHGDFIPSNAPLWQALTGFAVVYLVCYVVAVYLYKNKWFVKI
jgi:predicted acyltransferase